MAHFSFHYCHLSLCYHQTPSNKITFCLCVSTQKIIQNLSSLSAVFERTWYFDICTYSIRPLIPHDTDLWIIFCRYLYTECCFISSFSKFSVQLSVKKSATTADYCAVNFLNNSILECKMRYNLKVREQSLFPIWIRPLLLKSEICPRLELKRMEIRICERCSTWWRASFEAILLCFVEKRAYDFV
jgi:hypothetical protein